MNRESGMPIPRAALMLLRGPVELASLEKLFSKQLVLSHLLVIFPHHDYKLIIVNSSILKDKKHIIKHMA